VANGIDGEAATALHETLAKHGAVPRYIGPRLGTVQTDAGEPLEVEVTLEAMPSCLFDAVAVPGGKHAIDALALNGHALEFLKDSYRHTKPILALGEACDLVESAGIPPTLAGGKPDPGLLLQRKGGVAKVLPDFVKAIARHRHPEREMDPPEV